MKRRVRRHYGSPCSRGGVLLWAMLASAGMIVMTGMTFDAMLLQLTDWRTEREHVIVQYAARALIVQCEKAPSRTLPHTPISGDEGDIATCERPASWQPLHGLMRTKRPPEQWRRHLALAMQARGTRHLAWTTMPPATGRLTARHSPPVIVDAICLREKWIDDEKIGRVDVLTVRAQIRRTTKGEGLMQGEAGLWLQSVVARRPAPCHRAARIVREIVEPGRRGVSAR